ncbi:hypothetical protein YB2330_002278 [Saitoella coloradoensis]
MSVERVEAKVVILGAQGVGKTALCVRYIHGGWTAQSASTIGASFLTKKVQVDECEVRLQLWDTAGQERFRSMTPMYYRGSQAAILCYDITSRASFHAVETWLSELRKNTSNRMIIHVVGTKADLVVADPSKREVQFDECVAFATKHADAFGQVSHIATAQSGANDIPNYALVEGACYEISSKDDQGVEELFNAVTRNLVERREEIEREREALYNRRQSSVQISADIYPREAPDSSSCC